MDELVEHFSHYHPLKLNKEEQKIGYGSSDLELVVCSGCRDHLVIGPTYSCHLYPDCNFILHKSCAELPRSIHHPTHPFHPLILLSTRSYSTYSCDACGQSFRGWSFSYTCSPCDFDLDLKCASSWSNIGNGCGASDDDDDDDDDKKLRHCCHEHPLIFKGDCDQQKNENGSGDLLVVCNGCEDTVLGPCYTCNQYPDKCNFILHKSCAELPFEIHHPAHQKHPLILCYGGGHDLNQNCNACGKTCHFRTFAYECPHCDFRLHLKCASNWRSIIQNDCQDHRFTLFRKQNENSHCDVCGKEERDVLYLCSNCHLLVHKECAKSLPRQIKITANKHPLMLTWPLQDGYPSSQICKLCYRDMKKCRAVYSCQGCSYVAHTQCATRNSIQGCLSETITLLEEEHQDTVDAWDDGSKSLILDEAPRNNMREEETEFAAKVKHFSHRHLLLRSDHEVKDDDDDEEKITCDGCIQPISITDSFYRCTEHEQEEPCHFFLHTTCAQLPETKLHILDPNHLLTLYSGAPSVGGLFYCDMCCTYSQGFAYSGNICDFNLHPFCSMLSDSLTHEAHQHPLIFIKAELNDRYDCRGCGNPTAIVRFSCMHCNFSLCISCAKLPCTTARHRYDRHPLKLTYGSVENELGEHYCDICEGKRDPKHWFYSCTDCDADFHAHCLLGKCPQVRLGDRYKHYAHPHCHPC